MAAASGGLSATTSSTSITNEQRRWVVIGICLNKLLSPVLKNVLKNEISTWYNTLCIPPNNINTQTYKKYAALLPPSKLKLNYVNINNNTIHKTKSAYDYDVKDPESLAKLFVQPFMAKFTGFDQTMDLSAALTIMCEADPFHVSGAAVQARKVRSDVRNEWAHCNFSHWSDPNYLACVQEMELLVKALKLSSADENEFVNELNNWKDKGVQLCCGQPVDLELLQFVKIQVAEVCESLKVCREETKDSQVLRESLIAGSCIAETKMASKLSDHVCPKILNLKLDLLCNAKDTDEKRTISRYFRDLPIHAERLERLHDRNNLHSSAECFVNTRPMIARLLNKIHSKIMRRLHPKPNICNPWHGDFNHDVPMEVWDTLLAGVICHNSFGHEMLSSPSGILTTVKIFDIRKAVYIFDWQNMDGVIIPKKQLLKRNYSQSVKEGEVQERTEVIVSADSPLVFKWNKNSEVLQVTFQYGHWNEYGIPIH